MDPTRDDAPFFRGRTDLSWRTRLRDRTKLGKRHYDEDKSEPELPPRCRSKRTLPKDDKPYRGRRPKYSPFNFLGLPKDIRKVIFEQIIFEGYMEDRPVSPRTVGSIKKRYTSLATVCRKLSQEVALVYYPNIVMPFGLESCRVHSPFVDAIARCQRVTWPNISILRSMYLMFNDPIGYDDPSDPIRTEFYAVKLICYLFLEQLGQASRLRDLTIRFAGKRQVTKQHGDFIQHLKSIKTDRLLIVDDVDKADEVAKAEWEELAEELRKAMIREPSLYRMNEREKRNGCYQPTDRPSIY